MSFSTFTNHRAIREHQCEFCGKRISPGQIYKKVFIASEGTGISYKLHPFCDDIAGVEHREMKYEETTLDNLFEGARDKVSYTKDNASIAEYYGVTVEQINFVFGEVDA